MAGALTNRIALITGASRGIGAAVARRFAQEGAQLILVARDGDNLKSIDDEVQAISGRPATLVQLDLTELPKIDELASAIAQRFGKLDILVGNAAVLGEITPMAHTSPGEWHKTIDLNLHANWHLIRCFDTLLKASDAGRAMFVTSGVATRTAAYWGAYAVSKAALEMMVNLYAAETIKTSLRVNLIDPGAARTRMRAQAFPGEDPDTLTPPDKLTDIFVALASPQMEQTGQRFHAQKK